MLRDMAAVQPVRRRPREQVRADLLDAAERLVRTRGFRVSVDEIAAAAGMTKGAVYSNFANRAELMEAVAERVAPGPIDLDALVPESLTVAAAMERGALEMARRVDEHPEELVLLLDLLLAFAREPELLKTVRRSTDPGEHQAANRLQQRADREGRSLPRPAVELATVVDALALGLGITRLLHGPQAVADDLFAWALSKVVTPDAL